MPEKVHDLIPEAYRHASNNPDNYPGIRTAFYAQLAEEKDAKKADDKKEAKVKGNDFTTDL